MKPTQTGIAVALALVVIITFFVLPGLSPFGDLTAKPQPANVVVPSESEIQANQQTSNMPPEIKELQGQDLVVGTGATAEAGDTVTVNYVGALTNGKVFDASANHGNDGFSFKLGAGQVIKGWDVGVAGMKEGGKRKLLIPAEMAYGSQEVGGGVIPANSALIFEVELVKVEKAQ